MHMNMYAGMFVWLGPCTEAREQLCGVFSSPSPFLGSRNGTQDIRTNGQQHLVSLVLYQLDTGRFTLVEETSVEKLTTAHCLVTKLVVHFCDI